MSDDAQNPYLLYPEREVQKRVRYYDGQFLGSADFILAQSHAIDRRRRLTAGTVSPGVVHGYAIQPEPDAILISPGTAVDGQGRLLVLTNNARRVIQAADRGQNATVWVRYAEAADEASDEDKGASGLTRFDETPEIDYTPGGAAPADAIVLAFIQIDGQGNVAVEPRVRPRAGLRLPGPTPIRLAAEDIDPGRATLAGALRIDVPAGTAHTNERPALDVHGFGRFRQGLIIGQESATGYQGVHNDANDLVVNGQLAAGGSAGSAIFKLGVGMPPPAEGEGTLVAQRLAVGTDNTGGRALRVAGHARFESYADFFDHVSVQGEVRVRGGIDLAPGIDEGDGPAGKIRYKGWTDGLDIVGAGNHHTQRKITFHAQGGSRHIGNLRVEGVLTAAPDLLAERDATVGRNLTVSGAATVSGRTTTGQLTVQGDAYLMATDAHSLNARDRATAQHLTVTATANLNALNVGNTANLNGRVNVNGDRLVVNPVADFAQRVHINGDQLVVSNRLMPSAGNDNTKGIVWPGQGDRDTGAIRYYKEGDDCRMVLDVTNNADDVIVLRQFGGDRLTVRSGRVGINRGDPQSDLHVGGDARTDGSLRVDGDTLIVTNRLVPSHGTGDNGIVWQYNAFGGGGDAAKIQYHKWGGSEDTALVLENQNDANDIIVLKQKGGDRLTIKNGMVGINETAPTSSLHVSGGTHITGGLRVDGSEIDLGAKDANREANAGKIGYKRFSNDALDIVGGGGPNDANRKIRMWSEAGLELRGWARFTGGLALHTYEYAVSGRDTNLRVIWGAVKSNGTAWTGTGFSCSHYGGHVGVFQINFDVNFSGRPCVVATQHYPNDADDSNGWGNTRDNAIVSRVTNSWCQIVTGNGDGNRTWRSFEFIAIGRVN